MLSSLVYANTILKRALQTDTPLDPMKLQKLLYLTYARTLDKYDELLFPEPFECWTHGPVVRVVYDAFKCFGGKPIGKFNRDCNNDIVVVSAAHIKFHECFEEVWREYGEYLAPQLSKLTHQSGTAWSIAQDSKESFLQREHIKVDGGKFFA